MKNDIYNWAEELSEVTLSDKRLKERLFKMMDSFAASPSQSIFLATGGRSEAKAAYRFLVNKSVDPDALLEGIAKSTAQKISTMKELGQLQMVRMSLGAKCIGVIMELHASI